MSVVFTSTMVARPTHANHEKSPPPPHPAGEFLMAYIARAALSPSFRLSVSKLTHATQYHIHPRPFFFFSLGRFTRKQRWFFPSSWRRRSPRISTTSERPRHRTEKPTAHLDSSPCSRRVCATAAPVTILIGVFLSACRGAAVHRDVSHFDPVRCEGFHRTVHDATHEFVIALCRFSGGGHRHQLTGTNHRM